MRRLFSSTVWLGLAFLALPGVSRADTDLSISAAVAPSPVVVNGTSFLTVSVSNLGADAGLDAAVTVILPAGLTLVAATISQGTCTGTTTISCNFGTIAAGVLSVQATVVMEVTASTIGSINTDFSISSSNLDSNIANNTASALLEVVALVDAADLSVGYDTMANWVYQNSNSSFPVIVVNNGAAAATQSTLSFSMPLLTLADFVSAVPSQGVCTTALTGCAGLACIAALAMPLSVSCELSALSNGGSATVAIGVTTVGDVGDMQQLTATVSSSTTADPDSTNNQSSTTVELIALPDVEGGAGPGGCFIATAAYGSDMAEEVKLLRKFRDRYLLTNTLGKGFVAFYYEHSPAIAKFISQRDSLRLLVRLSLLVPVTMIQFPVIFLIAVFLGLSSAIWFLLLRNKRHHSAM